MEIVEAGGARIPAIGLGTWELRGRTCARLVEQALRLGYRHIDTAQVYENEREVGEGIRASGISRSGIFVTTKVWTTHFAPNDLLRSTKESLVRLRMSEVDLLLLHWPNPQVPLEETLAGLARAKQLGLPRPGCPNFGTTLDLHQGSPDREAEPDLSSTLPRHSPSPALSPPRALFSSAVCCPPPTFEIHRLTGHASPAKHSPAQLNQALLACLDMMHLAPSPLASPRLPAVRFREGHPWRGPDIPILNRIHLRDHHVHTYSP